MSKARRCIIPVFVPHLGCPNTCVFCEQHRISGEIQAVNAERVTETVERAVASSGTDGGAQLAFYGGSFTAIEENMQNSLLVAAQNLRERGLITSVRLSTRPDCVDDGIIRRLVRYGVDTVELGAQSMDDTVLRLTKRGHSAEDVRRASRLIKKSGVKLILQMMTGLPGARDESDIETARQIIDLAPNGVRIYPTVIVKGTELYDMWESGAYTEHSVEDAVRVCADIVPMFEAMGIEIIRLGLNPSEELSGGAAVGGAYHPALGELVRARIMYKRASELLKGVPENSELTLTVGARYLSQLIGQKGENRARLCAKYKLKSLHIKADDTGSMEIKIL